MSGPKHTPWAPGPWRIDVDEDAHVKVVKDSTGGLVAELFRRDFDEDPEHEANAKLIAAAPRLAEALKEIAEGAPTIMPASLVKREHYRLAKIARTALREAGVE